MTDAAMIYSIRHLIMDPAMGSDRMVAALDRYRLRVCLNPDIDIEGECDWHDLAYGFFLGMGEFSPTVAYDLARLVSNVFMDFQAPQWAD